jgi:hypothetical protein
MSQRIRYFGKHKDYLENGSTQFISIEIKEALEKGTSFVLSDYEMNLFELDELRFYMHKYCPNLDVKMKSNHEFSIRWLYNMCPEVLLELLEKNGGVNCLANILIGYDELYNQQINSNG